MQHVSLHLGCGRVFIPGFVNVDIQQVPAADLVCDANSLAVRDNSIELIYASAIIEHFGRWEWREVLEHWYSKLAVGGLLRISTVNFKAICEQYLETETLEGLFGLVIGGHRDNYDQHGMIFDYNYLAQALKKIGFIDIHLYDWRKTILGKLGIDDYSQAYLPHMNKEHGRLMCLNIEATKSA